MWVRKRPDIGWRDLVVGMFRCAAAAAQDATRTQQELEKACSESHDVLVCLSVRSGFDLLLSALELPAGSEVLMSALTIWDMPRIVREHGLVPVPVDLDVRHMGPSPAALEGAITPAARAVVVAHLFGARAPMDPILQIARQHKLLVIEDCAQAFDGRYRGHPDSDVAMFSFGPIKTATALGGAILRIRDPALREEMRRRQATYPQQGVWTYFRRLLKYAVLKAVCWPPLFGAFVGACRATARDFDRLINGVARSFPGPDLLRQIRQRPSVPLLKLLQRRLRTYPSSRVAQRIAKGERLAELLADVVPRPGCEAVGPTYWVFPILSNEPERLLPLLRQAGFDATQGSSMCAIGPPADRPELFPAAAAETLAHIVYLPFYPDLPDRAIQRMAQVLRQQYNGQKHQDAPPEHAASHAEL